MGFHETDRYQRFCGDSFLLLDMIRIRVALFQVAAKLKELHSMVVFH
jgi:hypothetical protein